MNTGDKFYVKLVGVMLATLLFSVSLCAQPMGHIVAGKAIWNVTDSVSPEWLKPVAKPMSAIASHIVMDKVVGESSLGDWQVYIGIVRAFTGYFVTDEKDRDDYLQYSFWALLPDILQKGLGWNWAHPEIGGDKIFNLNRDQNELLEEATLASLIFKWQVSW